MSATNEVDSERMRLNIDATHGLIMAEAVSIALGAKIGKPEANKLVEVERIMDISSRLVVNQAALKLKRERIRALIAAFAGAMNTPK